MKDIVWAYASKATSIASSLIIMPFALAFLSEAEFSMWMVFIVFFSMSTVIDFGFSVSISRQLNYIFTGADSVRSNGLATLNKKSSSVNYSLLQGVIKSSRFLFSSLSVISSLLLYFSYVFYVEPLAYKTNLNVQLEFLLYALSIVIVIYCFYYNALFFGSFNVHAVYIVNTASNLSFFITAIFFLYIEWGLLSIAIARLLSALVYFLFAIYQSGKIKVTNSERVVLTSKEFFNYIHILLPNSLKLGVSVLGSFFSTKFLILLTAYYSQPSVAASFSFSHNVLSVLSSLCLVFMTIKTPVLNSHIQKQHYSIFFSLQKKVRIFCLLMFLASITFIITFGDFFLRVINSQTQFLELYFFIFLAFSMGLEVNRLISTNLLMCFNKVEFHNVTLISGLVTVLVTYLCFEFVSTSIIVPILSYFLVHSLYNFWVWTYKEYRLFLNLV